MTDFEEQVPALEFQKPWEIQGFYTTSDVKGYALKYKTGPPLRILSGGPKSRHPISRISRNSPLSSRRGERTRPSRNSLIQTRGIDLIETAVKPSCLPFPLSGPGYCCHAPPVLRSFLPNHAKVSGRRASREQSTRARRAASNKGLDLEG